jgi:cation diffusion facilitator family transporter
MFSFTIHASGGGIQYHDHDHNHDHDHDHDHEHGHGPDGWIGKILHIHGHRQQKAALARDTAFAATDQGIRAVWLALAALGITSILQLIVVLWSGSVALFADTLHNVVDALNSVPLLIAFYLSRRAATTRYTYGFGRAEDVAGIFIVLSIVVSAGIVLYQSLLKLITPEPIDNIGWVAAAAIIGFVGNEIVARLQITTGRRIGSVALVADGQHARTDGFTSLAVLIAAGGSWLGFPIVDPLVGLVIGVAILFIAWDATRQMWYRLMDAIDPAIVAQVEQTTRSVPGVQAVARVRARWIGHTLHADVPITVNEDLPIRASGLIADEVRHALEHALPQLATVNVLVQPCGHGSTRMATSHA